MHRFKALPAILLCVLLLASCRLVSRSSGGSDYSPGWSDDDGFWGDDDDAAGGVGESPTGTFLDPLARGPGYAALDETCEQTDDPHYLSRFETPMFRDAVGVGDLAWLVDGGMLWGISLADPALPERRSLTRLPGHALALAALPDGRLVIAAGEAGLLVVATGGDEQAELVAQLALPGPALEVEVVDGPDGTVAWVALGAQGVAAVDLRSVEQPLLVGGADLPGFTNALAVRGDRLYAAACDVLSVVDVSSSQSPHRISSWQVPEGHAKGLAIDGDDLFVAGGEALFAFDVVDPLNLRWSGFYTDDEAEGFYVNGVVTRGGVAWIAAGDESVRAVDVSELSEAMVWLPPDDGSEPPGLDDAITLPEASIGTEDIETGDPIDVALAGDLLLVLGNFRWVGERMLRVMDISSGADMVDVGIYEQPDQTRGLAALADGLMLHRADGEAEVVDADGQLLALFPLPSAVRRSSVDKDAALLLEDGDLWLAGPVEGARRVLEGPIHDVARAGERLFIADSLRNEISEIDPRSADPSVPLWSLSGGASLLGFAHLAWRQETLYAYDWILGALHTIDTSGSAPGAVLDVGLCETWDLADFYAGTSEATSRLLVDDDTLVLLCPHDEAGGASLRTFDLSDPLAPTPSGSLELPGQRWTDVAVVHGLVYGLEFDNTTYTSRLSHFDGQGWKTIEYDGHANGFEVTDDAILVADGDLGLLRFGLAEAGALDGGGPQEGL